MSGAAYVRFIAIMAVGTGCAAVAPNVWVGIAAMALFGFGNGGAVVANITLVQRGAPDRVRGRAFTVLMSVNYAFLGLAFIAAGPLVNAYGARWAYAVASGHRGRRGGGGTALHPRHRARSQPGPAGERVTEPLSTAADLAVAVRAGETRALARAISLVEDGDPAARELVGMLFPDTGHAHTVGVTGPPGVGKSTLISALVTLIRARGLTAGRDLGRPDEHLHAGSAARRPDPSRRPFPRPRASSSARWGRAATPEGSRRRHCRRC